MGYSITLDGESVHLYMISECNPTADSWVIEGYDGYIETEIKVLQN